MHLQQTAVQEHVPPKTNQTRTTIQMSKMDAKHLVIYALHFCQVRHTPVVQNAEPITH